MLYKGLLNLRSADKTPVCDHLNESYWAVLSCVYYAVQGGSNFQACGLRENSSADENSSILPLKVYWAILSRVILAWA